MKKKKHGLFAGKKSGARRREEIIRFRDYKDEYYEDDDFEDLDEEYYRDDYDDRDYAEDEEYYSDDYDDVERDYREDDRYEDEADEDYREDNRYEDDEVDEDYRDEEDDRYDDEDADYREDEQYADDDRYEDDEDYREADRYEDEADEDYREDDNYDDEVDEDYRDEEADRYDDEDADYRDDEQYAEDDRYEDDEDYREDDRYEDEADEDYREDDRYEDEYYEDDYEYDRYEDDDRYAPVSVRGRSDAAFAGKSSSKRGAGSVKLSKKKNTGKRGRRKENRKDRKNAFAGVVEFIKNTNAVERTAAIVGIVIVAGAIVSSVFLAGAMNKTKEINSFAEVGSNMEEGQVIGQSGLIAVADAERARAITADIIVESDEDEIEEEADDTSVTINMNLTTIKSDMKIKFVNSKSNKLVASVPFKVDVVTPDGSSITYEDDDKDGIIYKKELKAGKYKVTPIALTGDCAKYSVDTSSKTITVKDTVEMKAVDVSNEIKKESQVNAAKEDTAVQTQVESVLKDTVEWVESTKTPIGDGEGDGGDFTYEEIDNKNIMNPIGFSRNFAPGTFVKTALYTTDVPLSENSNDGKAADSASDSSTVKPDGNNNSKDNEKNEDTPSNGNQSADNVTNNLSGESQNSGSGTESINGGKTDSESQNSGGSTGSGTQNQNNNGTGNNTTQPVNNGGNSNQQTELPKENKNMRVNGSADNPCTVQIKAGETKEITITDANGNAIPVTPASSDSSVAVLEGNRIKTFKGKTGKPTIILKSDGYKDFKIVVDVIPRGLWIEPANVVMTAGEKKSVYVKDEDGTIINGTISFSSDKPDVADVKDNTIVSSKKGHANIKVICNGYNQGLIMVDVNDGTGGKVPLKISKMTLMEGKKVSPAVSELVKDENIKKIKLTSDNTNIVKIEGDTSIVPIAKGEANITVSADGYEASDKIKITVLAKKDPLTDKDGNPLYMKNSDGKFIPATLEDYDPNKKFYTRKDGKPEYKYTGWQTIDGKTYFFTKDHEKVTGEQVIQGAKYTFGADGALSSSSGSRGIDVSKWNGAIDWKKVKNEGIDFAIIRCGYRGSSAGALIEDPTFRTNIKGAQAAGIKVGVYFFTQAVNEVEAVEEASMVINLCKGYGLSFPVYLDVEGSNGRGDAISTAQRTANIKAFCGTIQNAGYKAGVYANKTWFTSKINTAQLTNYKIWLAQYAANVTYNATRYDMWQYTSKGKVSGISGNVDMNTWYR